MAEWKETTKDMPIHFTKDGGRIFECWLNSRMQLKLLYDTFWKGWYLGCDFLYLGWEALYTKDVEEAKRRAMERVRNEFLQILSNIGTD